MAASAWHWRTHAPSRDALNAFFSEKITPLKADGLSVSRVSVTEGDCELGHRKGKLLTIYDLRIETSWQGKDSQERAVEGTLVCPEMAHDMKESEYQFETTTDSDSPEAEKFRKLAQTQLADQIRSVFNAFPQHLIDTYGSNLRSGTVTPVNADVGRASPAPLNSDGAAKPSQIREPLNTSTVRAQAEFQTTAEELFDLLTNEAKVPMWSRNPAQIKAQPGSEISLFNGNITGRMEEVERPKRFTSTWRAPTWPSDHYGRLHTTLKQGSDSTTLELRLEGVPKGEEDTIERNLDIFYLRSLKAIGLGGLIGSAPLPLEQPAALGLSRTAQALFGGLPALASFALIVGLIAAILIGPTRGLG